MANTIQLKRRVSGVAGAPAALKSGDRARLGVLRMVMAAIKQREVDSRETLEDGAVLSILEKMVKQRQESARTYEEGGRLDFPEARCGSPG